MSLNTFADPLLKKKAQSDQIRIVLQLFGKYSFLFEIPIKLRSYLLQKDPKSFSRIYQKNSFYLKFFSKLPILSKITEEVAKIINSMQGSLLEMISLKPKKFETINDLIQILFSLNFVANPFEFLFEHIALKLLNRVEKIFSQHIFETKVFNKDNINKRNTLMRKSLVKNEEEDKIEKSIEDYFNEEGDLLSSFISQKIGQEETTHAYNSKKFEEFSADLMIHFENLFILVKNYKEGNYDYHFKDMKPSDFKNIEDNVNFFYYH